jgi:hypothetical protein
MLCYAMQVLQASAKRDRGCLDRLIDSSNAIVNRAAPTIQRGWLMSGNTFDNQK